MANGRHLFISDLHLDATAPDAVAQFLRFLDQQARDCAGLYILGDLLETWVGDDDDEPVRNSICAALRSLTALGTPCWIMRGNRDFLLGRDFAQRTGCQLLPDPALLMLGQLRVVLTHGDALCTADARYQQFRSLARSPRFQQAYLQLPLPTRRALANMGRSRSHEHTRQTRTEIMDVSDAAVAAALRCADSSLLIHGHTHRPDIHRLTVDGRPATRIVLGDWYEQGSCLALQADGSYEWLALPRAATGSTVNLESSRLRV
jgi:UDP-2,3-diacylglucosamine hydrolase